MSGTVPTVRSRVRRYYVFQILVAFQIWSPFWSLWLFTSLNRDYFLATLVDIGFWIASLVVSIPAGALADRYGRKPALLLGVGIWLTGIVLFGLSSNFVAFVLSNIVWAFGAGFLWGAGSPYFYDTLAEARQEARYPALSSGVAMYSFLGTAAASVIGGAMVWTTNRLDLPLILYVIPGLGAFFLVWTFHEPAVERKPEPNLIAQIVSGVRTTHGNPQIVLIIAFQVLVGLVTYIMGFFRPAFISQVTEGNYLLMGLVYGAFFCIAAGSGATVGRLLDRFGETGGLVLAYLLVFPPFALVYTVSQGFFAPDVALALGVLSQIFDYMFWGIETPLITTILNRRVASSDRATVMAINSFFATLVIAVTEPPVGLLAIDYNFGLALALLALAVSIPTAVVLLGYRKSTRVHGILSAGSPRRPRPVAAEPAAPPMEDAPANHAR